MRILVVDDDLAVCRSIDRALRLEGYEVDAVTSGGEALEAMAASSPDALVLDLQLPDLDGLQVCRRIRDAGDDTPILMLTARHSIDDRVQGLDAGADDYLVKPFVEDELLARLRALLRRSPLPIRSALTVGDLVVDRGARAVHVGGREVPLGATEFRLLEYLAANAGLAVSRAQILERVWGDDFDGSSNVVDVYVSAVRRKLAVVGARDRIATVWGVGYSLHA